MRFYTILPILFITLVRINALGQDIQLSQFYAAALYMSPAFAGSAHAPRLSTQQRLQWPGLDAKYYTSVFSADVFFSKYKSGLGLLMLEDVQGSSVIKSSEVQLQYSYELPISQSLTFRSGLQLGAVSRNINYATLVYPDQYNDQGYVGATNDDVQGQQKVLYADISSGGILYSDRFWLGISAHHLNRPNQSFMNGVSRLPAKFDFVTGYRFFVRTGSNHYRNENNMIIIPTVHYKFQGKSDQIDIGVYTLCRKVIVGAWYRGIPFKHYRKGLQNNESVILLGGYKLKNLSISYSYDITVSKLNIVRTLGAHEINITYIFNKNKKVKQRRRLPCPKF